MQSFVIFLILAIKILTINCALLTIPKEWTPYQGVRGGETAKEAHGVESSSSYATIIKINNGVDTDEIMAWVKKEVEADPANNRLVCEYTKENGKAFQGFAGTFSKDCLTKLVDKFGDKIEYLEEDTEVRLQSQVQDNPPPWGLSRLSKHAKYTAGDKYYFTDTAGAGVDIYILDTGVETSNVQFWGYAHDFYLAPSLVGEGYTDLHGHGTAVASLASSLQYGVTRQANIRNVKVLNQSGSGLASEIVAAINKIVDSPVQPASSIKSIIVMSFTGPGSASLDSAINRAAQLGFVVIGAAGNNGADACNYSPARSKGTFAVSAIDINDKLPSWANYGTCVNLFAPGDQVYAVWKGGHDNFYYYTKVSGTSYSAPYVAGVAALRMADKAYTTAYEVYSDLMNDATSADLHTSTDGPLSSLPQWTTSKVAYIKNGNPNTSQ